MLRETRGDRFNFFLYEMIIRRNRDIIEKLERTRHMPGFWLAEGF